MSKTIFLIHGMWGTSTFWNRYCRFFESQGYHTKAVTLLNHEQPQDYEGLKRTGIIDYVEQCQGEIRQLHQLPVIIGYSMGGFIAQKLAEMGLAEKLILLAPVAPERRMMLRWATMLLLSANMLDVILYKKPFIVPFRQANYGLLNTLPQRERAVVYRSFVHESGLAAYEFMAGRVIINAAQVKCPVLVASGTEDRIISADLARKIAIRYSAAYYKYPGCCHYLGAERKIMEDVLAWMDSKK